MLPYATWLTHLDYFRGLALIEFATFEHLIWGLCLCFPSSLSMSVNSWLNLTDYFLSGNKNGSWLEGGWSYALERLSFFLLHPASFDVLFPILIYS